MKLQYIFIPLLVVLVNCKAIKHSNPVNELVSLTIKKNSLESMRLISRGEKFKVNWKIDDLTLIGLDKDYFELFIFKPDSLQKLWPAENTSKQINEINNHQWNSQNVQTNVSIVESYPNNGRNYFTITKPLFSINGEFAIIYYSQIFAPGFGRGYVVLYTKDESNEWKQIMHSMTWMS